MVKDVRSRLKSIAAKGGKYFTGTAKLFLASGTEIVNVNMPTLSGMMDVNRDLMNDTVRFLRNPVDTVNRNIDRAMSTEGWRAFQKFAKNALDDLKTGELYDPMRDRSSFGEGIDALLDNFGDFDMSGFDDAGEYQEGTDNGDFERDVALAESHEQAEDVRTQATIDAIGTSTRAVVNTQNANAQTSIRMSIKQHAQAMGAMQNMVTQQAATLTAVNAMASSILDVQREAHNQMMAQMKTVTDLLTEIRDNTAPKVAEQSEPPKDNDIFGAYGQIDIRKWMKAAYKNADEKYGISSTISMATGGMDMKTMLELAGDNPLQLVSDLILNQLFDKSGVKKSMERTGKYMQGFFPSLLDKLADRGRRFGKTQEEGGGKLIDLVAGILGVQTKAKGSIETGLKDPSAQAMITNRTVQAIEQVIPMWLSKIYSAVSGDPLQMYNYSTGKLTNVAQALAKQHHDVNDVAGRMSGAAYQVTRRAEAVRFAKVEDQEKFSEFMYQFLQKAAREGRHIDPWKSKAEWNEMLPENGYGVNEEYFSKLARAILRTMPRNQLMALSGEASDARVAQTRAASSLNNENRETGMGIIHSGMLGDILSDEIEAQSKKSRYGMSDASVDKLIRNRQARAIQTGTGVHATNIIMNDVLSTLKRGILTYTYIIGDSRAAGNSGDLSTGRRLLDSNGRPIGGGGARPSIPGLSQDVLDEILEDAGDTRERLNSIKRAISDDRRRSDEWKREQQEQRDKERRRTTRSNLSVSGIEDIIFSSDMNEDDMARVLQHLIVTETKDNESDNPNVERSRGYITSHIQKFKSKIGFDPKKTLGDNLANIARTAPFELIKSGLELSDALMFKVIFGQDTEGILDGSEDQPSLMRALSTSIKGHWKQAATWFGENIGKPLKSFLFDEKNGLMTRLGARVQEIFGEPIRRAGQKVKTSIIGEKEIGEDGQPTGRYVGGKLSNTINRVSQRASEMKNSVTGKVSGDGRGTPGIIDRFLYGDYSDTKRKGVKYVRDRGANGRFSGGHYEYQGFMGKLNQAGDQLTQMLFGPDADGNDYDSRKKAKFVVDELNKAAPDMIIGAGAMTALNAGMGLLTGLALPGGPLVAPLLGAGLSFVSSSEAFKKFLFGDQIEEEQEHYDMKTGKMVKSKVKTRKGSDLISKEVYEGIKRFAPKVAIGAMAGALAGGVGLLPFGMGPIIGTVLGSIGGMTAASDQLKKLIFGDTDSEEGDDSGLISKNFRKKLLTGIAEHGGGAVVGRLVGGAAGMLAGGILPGAFGAILGPVLGTAGTVIGAISGPKLMDMLFGEEQDVPQKDPDGKDTGKTVKKRVGGMFGKMFDGVKTRMVEPLAKGIDKVGHKIGDWFQESVVDPFDRALQPMKDAMTAAGNAVKDTMKNIVTNISDNIKAGMEKVLGRAVENPLKDFFQEKIIKPLTNVTNRIFSTVGKIIGNIISAPFKAVEYIFAGTIGGKTPDELKDERQQKKDAERNSKLTDKLGKAQDSLKAASSRFGRIFSFLGGSGEADVAVDENGNPIEKKGFFNRLRRRGAAGGAATSTSDPTGTGAVGTPSDATGGTSSGGTAGSSFGSSGRKRRWVPERGPNGRFTGRGHYEDIDETSAGTGTGAKPGAAYGDGSSDERKRLKDMAAAKNAERKDREDAAISEREKREEKKAQADAAETAKKNGRKKSNKTDNEYLKDIEKHSRAIPKIFEEINGQLGNTGWNLGYIKKLLEKQFGELSAEELPEEMEGSRKNVKKRRGFFGKMFDRIAGVFGGIGERVRDTITGAIDIVIHPFRLLGKAVTGVVDIVRGAGETLWGIAKTIGSAIGEVLKGAAQGIGNILAGAGKAIYAASSGIGKALGDTLATLTGVLKDGILGLSSVVRGLVETAAAIAPDLAKAAWKGMKFVGGVVGKGIKFAADGVAGGVSWLFNKITGRGEGGERTKTKIKKLGKFVIDGGYLDEIRKPVGIAIGGDAMIPFPFVRLLKGRLTRRSNIAIPVFIMGSDGGSSDVKEPKAEEPRQQPSIPGGTPMPKPENADEVNSDQAGKPQGAKPRKSLRETAANAATRMRNEANKKLERFKRKYFNVDRRAERSNNPAEEYDRAMQSASSQEEIEAVQAAQQMNANSQIISTGEGEGEKKSGLLDLLLGGLGALFGKGGIKGLLGKLGTKIAGSTVGKAAGSFLKGKALPFLGEAAGMAATGYQLFGEKGNKLWGAETVAMDALKIGKAVAGNADEVLDKSPIKKAIAKLIKSLTTNATVVRMFGAAKSKLGTLATKLTNKLGGEVLEQALKSGAQQAKGAIKQIAAFASGGTIAIAFAIADFVSGFGNAKKYFNVFGSDVSLGMRLTSGIVNTLGGLLSLIPGIGPLLSVAAAMFQDSIVQMVYGLLAGDTAKAELAANQQKLQAATDQYNAENGTDLTTDEYAKKFNEDGSRRTFLGSVFGGIKSVGKGIVGGAKKLGGAVVGGVKKVGSFALKAVTAVPNAISKGAEWLGNGVETIGTKLNEFVTNLPETVSNGINGLFKKVGDVLTNLPSTVGKFIGDSIGKVIKGIGGIGEFAVKLGSGIINGAIKVAGSLGNMLLGIAKGIGNILLSGVKLVFETPKILGNLAVGIGKGVINTIGSAIGGINNFISEIIKGIGNAIKEALGGIGGAIDQAVESIPVVGDAYKGVKKVGGAIADGAKAVGGFVEGIPVVGGVVKGAKKVVGGALDLAEKIPLAGGLIKGVRGIFGGSSEPEEETGKGPGMSETLKKLAMMGVGVMNPMAGMTMVGGKIGGSLMNKFFGGNAAEMPTSTNTLSSVVSSLADKITGAINTAKGIADENGLDTSSIGGFLSSALKDPKAVLNSFMSIGKGVGSSLIDMVTSVFKDKKQAPTIFSIMGEGVGNSLVADLKNTEGKNATISNSMSTAMTATLTGGDVGAAKRAVQNTKKQGFWSKVGSTVSSWMPWNWGKGPGGYDEMGVWGHGPVSPMSQSAGKWNRGSRDMAMNGCGPTAAAMVASAYGAKGANPGEANRMSYGTGMRAVDGGTNPSFFSKYANAHGYGMSEGPVNAGMLSRNLRNGQPAVVMGKGGAFGKNMHYMVADRENGRGGVGLVDPLTGSRKTTTMKGLMSNTKTAIYSYGRSAWGHGPEEDTAGGSTTASDDIWARQDKGGSPTLQTGGNPLSKPFKITSPFGYRVLAGKPEGHKGVDLVPTDGSGQADVGSRWNGTVKSVKRNLPNTHTGLGVSSDTAGNYVIITTDDGYIAKHFHLKYNSIPDAIQPGAHVTVGQKIGEMGTTGRSTGPHLHYQLEDSSGKPFDPASSISGGTTMSSFTNGATTAAAASGTASAGTTGSSNTNGRTASDGSTSSSTGVGIIDALSTMFSSISGKLGNLLTILMGGTPDADMMDDPGGATTDANGNPVSTTGGTTFNFGASAGSTDPTENKKEAWRFLRKDFGLNEAGTAGLMGCWQSESGVRPDRLEGDYLGAWKKKFGTVDNVLSSNSNLNDYVLNYLFPAYDRSGISISKSGYKMADGNYYPGLGLAQWTRGRAYNLLQFAQSNNMDWRKMSTQLKFFQHETSQSFPKLKDQLNAATTAEEGARAALDGFEMYSGWSNTKKGQSQLAERAKNAAQIYNTYHGTSIDDAPAGTYISTGNAQDDIWKRGEGLKQISPEDAAAETGKGWGRGPAVDMGHARNTTMDEIRRLNRLMEKTRDAAESESTAATIAGKITEALSGGSTSTSESTALLKTIADAMGTMVALLEKISKNTEQGEESELAGDSASATNKRRSNLPVVSPLYPNQDKKPEDIGLTVINQLTTV